MEAGNFPTEAERYAHARRRQPSPVRRSDGMPAQSSYFRAQALTAWANFTTANAADTQATKHRHLEHKFIGYLLFFGFRPATHPNEIQKEAARYLEAQSSRAPLLSGARRF